MQNVQTCSVGLVHPLIHLCRSRTPITTRKAAIRATYNCLTMRTMEGQSAAAISTIMPLGAN